MPTKEFLDLIESHFDELFKIAPVPDKVDKLSFCNLNNCNYGTFPDDIEVYTIHTIFVKVYQSYGNVDWIQSIFNMMKVSSKIDFQKRTVWSCTIDDGRGGNSKFEKLSNARLIGIYEEDETVVKWCFLFLKASIDIWKLSWLEDFILEEWKYEKNKEKENLEEDDEDDENNENKEDNENRKEKDENENKNRGEEDKNREEKDEEDRNRKEENQEKKDEKDENREKKDESREEKDKNREKDENQEKDNKEKRKDKNTRKRRKSRKRQ